MEIQCICKLNRLVSLHTCPYNLYTCPEIHCTCYDNRKLLVYESVLEEINRLTVECDVSKIVLGGDWNTDFSRDTFRCTQAC